MAHLPRPYLCIFDFSRRGWSSLPLRDGGGTERGIMFEDGRSLLLQGDQKMTGQGFHSLGDGRFMYLVSRFHRWIAVEH